MWPYYLAIAILTILLAWVLVLFVFERARNSGWRKRDASVTVERANRMQEILRLRDQLREFEAMKAEVRRLDGIRTKGEKALNEKNDELDYFRKLIGIVKLP